MYFIVQPKDKGIWRTVLLWICASTLSRKVWWPYCSIFRRWIALLSGKKINKKWNPRARSGHNCSQRNLFRTLVWIVNSHHPSMQPGAPLLSLSTHIRNKQIFYYKLHFLKLESQWASHDDFWNNQSAKMTLLTVHAGAIITILYQRPKKLN